MGGVIMSKIKLQHDELEEVRLMLNGWGAWLRSTSVCSLDFPRKANFVIMPGGRDMDYEDESAEVIEEILIHLKREIPLAFRVIQQDYYFENSIRNGAEKLGIKTGRYREMKMRGESFVQDFLIFIKNSKKLCNIA